MKNLKISLLIALLVAFILPSCGKYEEGPAISFRSKTSRLVNEWKIDKWYQAGDDITQIQLDAKPDYVLTITEDGNWVETYTVGSGTNSTSKTWEFSSDKKSVVVSVGGVSVTYEILKLKKDELWLKNTITSGVSSVITEAHYVTK
jgi:hypothetical protein